jgi:hypothetical protein
MTILPPGLILVLSYLLDGNPILPLRRYLKTLSRLKNSLARVGSLYGKSETGTAAGLGSAFALTLSI